ncbi:hypothetical protein D3C83_299790 [compost metagenome]
MLLVVLHGALPAIHGTAGPEDVDASRQALLEQQVGEALRAFAVGQVSEHQELGHAAIPPAPSDR